jgi:hypothetical protein
MAITADREKAELFLQEMRSDFVLAARTLLYSSPEEPLELWWGQRKVMTAMMLCRFVMCIAGRGLGKSYLMAVYGILRCILFPRHRVGIVSASFRQAKFVFSEIKKIYHYSPILQESASKPPVIGSDTCYLEFNNGSIIIALPLGDGETIRGARFHTLLADEAVKIPQEILELSILPMMNVQKDPMMSVRNVIAKDNAKKMGILAEYEDDRDLKGNQIIFMSTAWFQFCNLYKIYADWKEKFNQVDQDVTKADYAVYEFPYTSAPEGFLDPEYIEMTRKTMSPVRFAMENLAYWPPDTDGFYSASIFERVKLSFAPKLKGDSGKQYIIAIDPARESDNFIIAVFELGSYTEPTKVIYMDSIGPDTFKTPNGFAEMHDKFRKIHRAFPTTIRICLDAGGGGLSLRDMMSEEYVETVDGKEYKHKSIFQIDGQNDVHDKIRDNKGNILRILDLVNFSTEWLNISAWELRNRVEQGKLVFPTPPKSVIKENLIEDASLGSGILIDIRDIVCNEIDMAIEECTNVEAVELPSRKGYFRFQTPSKKLKKDRWAVLVMGAKAILDLENAGKIRPSEISNTGASIEEIQRSYVVSSIGQVPINLSPIMNGINEMNHSGSFSGNVRINPGAASLA